MLDLFRRMTLRRRLVALAGVAILPPLAALVLVVVAFHQQSHRVVEREALRTSEIVALEMQRIVSGTEGVLASLGSALEGLGVGADCASYLHTVAEALPQYGGFAITDAGGAVLCVSGAFDVASVGTDAGQMALHQSAAGIGFYTVAPDGRAYLPIALALVRSERTILVLTALDLAWLGDRLSERTLGRGSAIAIADQKGTIIARQPQREAFVGEHLSEAMSAVLTLDRPGVRRVASRDGLLRVVGYQPPAATGLGLFVAAGFSTAEAMAPVWESTWRAAAVVLFGTAVSFILAAAAGERLLRRPVLQILDTVERWRAGDETARTGITADASELSVLAAAIDQYRDELIAARAAREAAEVRRSVLLREMNHRIKNLFATVQAIANQSFRDRAAPDGLRIFGARLAAMARTHDLLVGENRETANLEEVVRAAIEPFRSDGECAFTLAGSPLRIRGTAALALSMALHELCTNAAKYGALSRADGRIAVTWGVRSDDQGVRFIFSWTETGGPPVLSPERTGFGTRLVERILTTELNGTGTLEFPGTGLRFTLDADAGAVLQRAAAVDRS